MLGALHLSCGFVFDTLLVWGDRAVNNMNVAMVPGDVSSGLEPVAPSIGNMRCIREHQCSFVVIVYTGSFSIVLQVLVDCARGDMNVAMT